MHVNVGLIPLVFCFTVKNYHFLSFFSNKKYQTRKSRNSHPLYPVSVLPVAAPVLAVFPPKIVDQSLGGGVTGSINVASVAMLVGSWFCCCSIFAWSNIWSCCFCSCPIPGICKLAALLTWMLDVSKNR